MRFLIATIPGDTHSIATAWGLRRRGHEVVIITPCDVPRHATVTLNFGSKLALGIDLKPDAPQDQTQLSEPFDVGLMRRRAPPALLTGTHEADKEFAEREARTVADAFHSLIDVRAWVNPKASWGFSELKPLQLKIAEAVGFSVPPTIISNNAEDVLRFAKEHGAIACKTLNPSAWTKSSNGAGAVSYTARVTSQQIEARRESIRLTPAIYQAFVEKDHELRITMMGGAAFAGRIETSHDQRLAIDWRMHSRIGASLTVRRTLIDDNLLKLCRSYLDRSGMLFGCFDFIVDRAGRTHFLEVNPMGQFLWKEMDDPSLPLLDAFCRFLETPSSSFEYNPGNSPVLEYRSFHESESGKHHLETMVSEVARTTLKGVYAE